MHPECPGLSQMQEAANTVFATYDLHYTLSDMSVVSWSATEARVHFAQITEQVSGPSFRKNRIEGIHIFKKHAGEWKLYNTETTQLKYIEQ